MDINLFSQCDNLFLYGLLMDINLFSQCDNLFLYGLLMDINLFSKCDNLFLYTVLPSRTVYINFVHLSTKQFSLYVLKIISRVCCCVKSFQLTEPSQ